MKIKKCPYCSKRISYGSVFSSRQKAEYVCDRCKKESKVTIDRTIYIAFALAASISVAIMAGWILAGMSSNPLGILLVALPLIVFTFISPNFLKFEPLKKYKKSMEAKKAGIEFSDNLVSAELEDESPLFGISTDSSSEFTINNDVFNKIKAERNAAREKLSNNELISNSSDIKVDKEKYVPIINDVRENNSSTDAPLKKIHSDGTRTVNRTRHYISVDNDKVAENKKPDGNKYSANRKF